MAHSNIAKNIAKQSQVIIQELIEDEKGHGNTLNFENMPRKRSVQDIGNEVGKKQCRGINHISEVVEANRGWPHGSI